jgi:carboxyl-terminal processing protease
MNRQTSTITRVLSLKRMWNISQQLKTVSLLLAAIIIGLNAPAESTERQRISPIDVYHHAWEEVRQRYYDSTFNSQDWSRWQHRYDRLLVTRDDSQLAISTMLASLGDPYTDYQDSGFVSEFYGTDCWGHEGNIGAPLALTPERRIIVIAPPSGTPAAKAGLRGNDELVEIDGRRVCGCMNMNRVIERIVGPVGTPISTRFMRQGTIREYRFTRSATNEKNACQASMLRNDIGYISLNYLKSENAPDAVKKALLRLDSAHGIILDLRNNAGGLTTNAVQISNIFLKDGVIVSTAGQAGIETRTADGTQFSSKPLVVIVNEGTAGAAEVIAAALKTNGRSELVGQKTFGQGLVQCTGFLEDGTRVRMSTAQYLTPDKKLIEGHGITPDFRVDVSRSTQTANTKDVKSEETVGAESDSQLATAVEVMRSKLNGSIRK